ncbi:MAG: hypothetical protein AAB501_01145 [Patescibacteria group bacterium]
MKEKLKYLAQKVKQRHPRTLTLLVGSILSITMMKEQSVSIQKMAEMMKSGGVTMQELGMKYKDENAVEKGKDLQAVGEKYVKENEKATEDSASMKQIMDK